MILTVDNVQGYLMWNEGWWPALANPCIPNGSINSFNTAWYSNWD